MTKSIIGYSLIVVLTLIFIIGLGINMYTFTRRNALYFNKRNWSNKISKGDEDDESCS